MYVFGVSENKCAVIIYDTCALCNFVLPWLYHWHLGTNDTWNRHIHRLSCPDIEREVSSVMGAPMGLVATKLAQVNHTCHSSNILSLHHALTYYATLAGFWMDGPPLYERLSFYFYSWILSFVISDVTLWLKEHTHCGHNSWLVATYVNGLWLDVVTIIRTVFTNLWVKKLVLRSQSMSKQQPTIFWWKTKDQTSHDLMGIGLRISNPCNIQSLKTH